MILTGNEIIFQVKRGGIVIEPFRADQVQPNSYDLRLGDKILEIAGDVNIPHKLPYTIYPSRLYLGHTEEDMGSCHYVPLLDGRSSWARKGLQIHLTAGFGDLGFVGQWTLELNTVANPIHLIAGQRICQVSFWKTQGVIDKLYSGKYVGSRGVVPSRLDDE